MTAHFCPKWGAHLGRNIYLMKLAPGITISIDTWTRPETHDLFVEMVKMYIDERGLLDIEFMGDNERIKDIKTLALVPYCFTYIHKGGMENYSPENNKRLISYKFPMNPC